MTDPNPLEAMLCYKQLWTVEQTFRTAKHLFSTRPIFHKLDETIRGHVFAAPGGGRKSSPIRIRSPTPRSGRAARASPPPPLHAPPPASLSVRPASRCRPPCVRPQPDP